MTQKFLKEKTEKHFYCLEIDNIISLKFRKIFRHLFFGLSIIVFIFSFDDLPLYFGFADAMFFFFLFLFILFSLVEFFYRAMLDNSDDFTLSKLLFDTDEIDVTRGLFESEIGNGILFRAGLTNEDINAFTNLDRTPIIFSSLELTSDLVDTLHYLESLYNKDLAFQNFLSVRNINKEEFLGAVKWVMDNEKDTLIEAKFWSIKNLNKIPSIGTSWSYGVAHDAFKFGSLFQKRDNFENNFREKEVSLLENILARKNEANAIIIDDDESVARDILLEFLSKIKSGKVSPVLEHKNIVELDFESILSSFKNRSELESEIIKIFNQSVLAGNIILYIKNISTFIAGLNNFGINFSSIFSNFINSPDLQVIAHSTNTDFHFFIENNSALVDSFERVLPESVSVKKTSEILLTKIRRIESQYKLFFTYPSILKIAESADRFITYGEMPKKAIDLLYEFAPFANQNNIYFIKENHILDFVSKKTGIVSGDIKTNEVHKINHLEELLHKRVVGQEEAIKNIASSIRRSRAGMNNYKKPISSFLFLGPTGVGKTEVSKSLAESFFGDEKNMIRFDMSEYNNFESLSRLIGDFNTNKNGILASKIRDNPYSVLLLDEIEKASKDVLDLFLQILDEGIFSDVFGKEVNCRNLMIIATSNAGSDLIWQIVKSGKNLNELKDTILENIITNNIFKRELINRFDGVIVFHPLDKNHLNQITLKALLKLKDKLKQEKNIECNFEDDLVEALVSSVENQEFGARPINRIIQDKVEDFLARKITSGELKSGDSIAISKGSVFS